MQLYCIGGGGGGGGPGNQSVSGVTTICLTQYNTSPSHRVDQVVDCGLCNVGPLLFMSVWSCWILSGTGRIRRSRASQTCSMGDMSGEYAGHARTGCFQLPGIVYRSLQYRAVQLSCCNMRWWSWWMAQHGPQYLSSRYPLCIKMPSIKCTCVHLLIP